MDEIQIPVRLPPVDPGIEAADVEIQVPVRIPPEDAAQPVAEANSKVTTVTVGTAACDKKGSQCSSHNFAIRVWFVLTWHSRKKSGIVC